MIVVYGRFERQPLEERKKLLAKLLKGSHLSIVLNETFEEDGAIVFREACKLGCEGIVSKRLGLPTARDVLRIG
jgi:bifunctional non-homologous end joining protein LigD